MKVSVILPVYNSEEYLEESIESILNQTISNFELIIVLDKGDDNSKEIAERYKEEDARVRLSVNDGLGLSKCLNKGIEMADGKYIARQDADDISEPERLEKQYRFLEQNKDIFLCGTEAKIITEKDEVINKRNLPKDPSKNFPEENKTVGTSIFFRNDEEVYFREKFPNSEDFDLYLRLATEGKKLRNVQEPLVKYRIRRDSLTRAKSEEQNYYGEKARKFYRERKDDGKDSYEEFKPKEFEEVTEKRRRNEIYQKEVITKSLKSGNFSLARKYSKIYFVESRNVKIALLYILSSYIPPGYHLYSKIKNILSKKP